jgi:Ca2+-binding RTX toxin-like protein
MKAIGILAGALTALALLAPTAAAHDDDEAEIFATNNTAVITDPADPRLRDRLKGFAREVERIIDDGGARPRGSELLDGVFASGETTTFERSRVFDVDRLDDDELHTIADTIRARFSQQSVLTFEPGPGDAIRLEVPSVTAQDLREGLLEDAEARERLFGGSVTQDRHLVLIAAKADAAFARAFAKRIGGDLKRAETRSGVREFVEGPLPVRVVKRTLFVDGTAGDDAITIDRRSVTLNGESFSVHRYDRVRVDGGDGLDTLAIDGERAFAAGDRVRLGDAEVDGVETLRLHGDVTVGDLSRTDVFQVDIADSDRATVLGSEDDDQISIGAFGVLGPTFVRVLAPEPSDRLTVDGRGGDDIISASIASLELTLVGGSGDNVLLGGPGNDRLIGGNGFDDVRGGKGSDVAWLGGNFDRFSWSPGDGSDVVDGGASRDSLSFQGTSAAEAFTLDDGRLTRDGDAIAFAGIEEINAVAGGGADTFAVGRAGVQLVDISLASIPITPLGDGAPDRVTVTGTDKADAMKLVGKGTTATLTGLPATVNISHAESADTLAIDTRGGADTLDTSAFAPGTIGLEVNQPAS